MANTGPAQDFRKLRLDTHKPARHSHAATEFPFAASSNADHVASSAFSSQELLGNPDNSCDGHNDDDDDELSRPRGSSVSFKNFATLDDGRQHSLDHPLPKPTYSRRRSTQSSSVSSDSQSQTSASAPVDTEDSPYRINPFTGEPIRRRTRKSEIAPRLETIDSHDSQQPPSMTTASTASLLSDQLKSPSPQSNNSYLLSSTAVSSPVMSPSMSSEPWPMMPQKNKTLSRTHSLRNCSRRSSRISNSSMSPASAFLSQWGRESVSSSVPEPDDEGQTLGLEGEYIIGRQIGFGGFSVVKEVIGMADDGRKTKRAVKIVRKAIANVPEAENDKYQQTIEHEIGIWRYLQHDHIMHLHAAYDTDFATFCIMDLMEGGSLFDIIRQRRKMGAMGLGTDAARKYAYQLASALRYLHEDVRLVHRDVKLENCLIQSGPSDDPTTSGSLKLCDFGLADFLVSDISDSVKSLDSVDSKDVKDRVGTLQYAAPEVLASSGSHLRPCTDIWAFGCCLYTLITGSLPFTHPLEPRIVELISSAKWNRDSLKNAVPTADFDDVNDLVEGCLAIDPEERWSIGDVMNSPWFSDLQDMTASTEDWQFLNNRHHGNGS